MNSKACILVKAASVSAAVAKGMTTDELNFWGAFFTAVGSNLILMAATPVKKTAPTKDGAATDTKENSDSEPKD
jgi:hypothetical protein